MSNKEISLRGSMKNIFKNRKLFKFFYDYQKKHFGLAIIAGILLCLNVLLQLPMPLVTRYLIDNIIPAKDFQALKILCLILFGIIILSQLSSLLMRYVIMKYKARVHYDIERELYLHIQELPMSYFSKNTPGYIFSRISEVSSIETVMADTFLNIIKDIITMIVGAVLILSLHFLLGLVSFLILPFFILSIKSFHSKIKNINKELNEETAQYTGKLEVNLNSIEKIKSSVKEYAVGEKLSSKLLSVIKIRIKAQLIDAIANTVAGFIGMLSPFIVLWIGVSEIMHNSLTLGSFVAINSFLTYLYNPARRLSNIGYDISHAMASLERVFEIFSTNQEESKGKPIRSIEEIIFDNVHFSYNSSKKVLNGLNLKISRGEKIAIVGESGKGKSTIAKMLLKFYSPESGNIYISGQDSRTLSIKSLREKIAYISQNQRILEDTLEKVTNEPELNSILNAIRFKKEIINKDIQQSEFSGGEVQKIEIMEALVKNADLLIVDEGTSNIDYNAEKIALRAIMDKYKNKIVIFIAHRLSSITDFKRILVIENGIVIEEGIHQELLENKGKYYFLWGVYENQTPNPIK